MNDKTTLWIFLIVFGIAIIGAIAYSSGLFNSPVTKDNSFSTQPKPSTSGDVQVVKLRVQGSNYILEPATFKKGVPVRIEADMSQMPGCSKSVVISAFNIRTTLSSSSNIIEFTPDKAGTFNIACSMNMYRGTFTVTD